MSGKKTKRRINVIDVIIILLILALVATVVFNVYNKISDTPSNKHGEYVMTFEFDDEYNSLLKHLTSGTAIYFYEDGTLIGYITESKSKANDTDTDEIDTGMDEKDRFQKQMRLASNAVKAKDGDYYTIENVIISKGSKIKVYTEKAVFTLTVKDISKG